METNGTLGRHLVATEEIKPEFLIFKDKPIVLGPKVDTISAEIQEDVCVGCYSSFRPESENGSIKPKVPCPHCDLPLCSEACSQQYFHRNFECRLIRDSENAPYSLGGIRTEILQNLIYLRCILISQMDQKLWSGLTDMASNSEIRTENVHLDKTKEVYDLLQKILTNVNNPEFLQVDKSDVHTIIGVHETNAVEVKLAPNVELTVLYPLFSIMEHSCFPNVKYYFVPANSKDQFLEVYVRAATKLKKGEHLAISYTNILWSTQKRREHLKRSKYLWCRCVRCMDPTELDTNFSTILCPSCKKSYALPFQRIGVKENEKEDMHWKCLATTCGKICEAWQVKRMDLKMAELVTRVGNSIGSSKEMLSKMEELVHPQYYMAFVVNHSLIQMYGRDLFSGKDKGDLEEKLKICNELLNTIKKLDPGMARLNIYAAVIYFEMHSAILAMAGGENDDDFHVLRKNVETVHLARLYLSKCIDCFEYELFDLPEKKLKTLASKKMEYLNLILKHGAKNRR